MNLCIFCFYFNMFRVQLLVFIAFLQSVWVCRLLTPATLLLLFFFFCCCCRCHRHFNVLIIEIFFVHVRIFLLLVVDINSKAFMQKEWNPNSLFCLCVWEVSENLLIYLVVIIPTEITFSIHSFTWKLIMDIGSCRRVSHGTTTKCIVQFIHFSFVCLDQWTKNSVEQKWSKVTVNLCLCVCYCVYECLKIV